jgi:hypothetical protein
MPEGDMDRHGDTFMISGAGFRGAERIPVPASKGRAIAASPGPVRTGA